MWRPSDWEGLKQPHLRKADKFYPKVAITDNGSSEYECEQMFEAGADAMLEALRNEPAVRLRNDLETIDQYVIKTKDLPDGTWRVLIIPEEDKE